MIKLRTLLENSLETHLSRLENELKDYIREYRKGKETGNADQMAYSKKFILMLAAEIKKEKVKSPEELDRDAFLGHHYTGYIGSDAYRRYEKEGGLSWLGSKSKYPVLLHRGKYGQFDVEFRQTGQVNKYAKTDANGDAVKDVNGEILTMTPEEILVDGLPPTDTSVVAFVNDKPIGFSGNEFGAVGVWVEGPYQRVGIGTDLMDFHIEQRPTIKSGKDHIGQATDKGISLMKSYHRKMSKRHGTGWFKQLRVSKDD
jgi:hypothetical protein